MAGDLIVVEPPRGRGIAAKTALAPPLIGDWRAVGRDRDLQRLHDRLHANASVVACGLGGVGKTTLAIAYIGRYSTEYELIAWVEAEPPDLIPRQYQRLLLNYTGQRVDEAESVDAVKALLASSTRWLIVYDNAPSREALEGYLPSGQGHIIITTRNELWTPNPRLLFPLDPLPVDVVAQWVSAVVPGAAEREVRELAERLDGLPLAVVQAISYLNARAGETLRTFLDQLETADGQKDVLSQQKPAGYPRPLAATWTVAAQALSEETDCALDLLRLLSFVEPHAISVEMLADLLPRPTVTNALEALRRYGLVRYASGTVSVHRLVQDVTRWPLDPEAQAGCVRRWASHLRKQSPDPRDPQVFEWFEECTRHVVALSEHATRLRAVEPDLAALLNHAGISHADAGHVRTAVALFQRALAMKEAAYGPNHVQTAPALDNLGIAFRQLGDLQSAISLHRRAVQSLRTLTAQIIRR